MAEIIDPLEIGEETNPEEDPLFKYKVFQNLSQPAPDLGGKNFKMSMERLNCQCISG